MKKEYLENLRIFLKSSLSKLNEEQIIKLSFDKAPVPTNTGGYLLEILNVNNKFGLDFWLDDFTNTGKPKLCLALWSNKKNLIDELLKVVGDEYLSGHKHKMEKVGSVYKLKEPLPSKYFGHFVVEPYEERYLTYYFDKEITLHNLKSANFKGVVLEYLNYFYNLILNEIDPVFSPELDYSAIENRMIISQHKLRERDSIIARNAKKRDDYTCQICNEKLVNKYGDLAKDFAEAHHIIPLNKYIGEIKTTMNDLITVCPNCHRMLHRMNGEKGDISKLKRKIKNNYFSN